MDKIIGPLTDINTVNCAGYFIEILGTEISGLGGGCLNIHRQQEKAVMDGRWVSGAKGSQGAVSINNVR